MRSSEFMERIPVAVGVTSSNSTTATRIFTLEVWSLKRLGRLEIGLHFESRDRAFNERMFLFFDRYIIEIKAQLGKSVDLERWDRGWTRIFESIPLPPFDEPSLENVSTRLAEMISLLQPLCESAVLDNSP